MAIRAAARMKNAELGYATDFVGKAGVGQVDPISPLTFQAGPGGVPLPAAPTSTAI